MTVLTQDGGGGSADSNIGNHEVPKKDGGEHGGGHGGHDHDEEVGLFFLSSSLPDLPFPF